MDPIANINQQRAIASEIINSIDGMPDSWEMDRITEMAQELAGLVQDLDAWRKRGGFDPYQRGANPDCAACGATVYQHVCVKCGEQAKP
jgi:hypothetical protein